MQSQVSTLEKNPSCTSIHIKTTSERQTAHNIKENTASNSQNGSSPPIQYTNMTIAEIVRASR